jgi:predicted kinase
MAQGRLIIIAGLPGSGKTTLSRQLASRYAAVILSPDDWMDALAIDLWDTDRRDRVERLQWQVAAPLLAAGGTVIVEWGTWARTERDLLRQGARQHGAAVHLVFLDAPPDVLYERVASRGRECPPITLEQLRAYSAAIERPSAEEIALFDPLLETS